MQISEQDFYGGEFNREYYEALAVSRIPLKVLRLEAPLYAKKWYDYRPYHPTKATYLLAECYTRAFQRFMAQAVELKASYTKGFKGRDVMEAREKLSFWKLRMKCDEYGLKYDFACRFAMEWCLLRGWGQPPRPSHIYSDAELWIDLLDAWERENRGSFQYATHPRYAVDNFLAAPDQVEYENRIVKMVLRSPARSVALSTAMYARNALRFERALQEFGEGGVRRALEFS
ncbi:hypothetical protein ACODYM_29365 [Burkholderia gladioli]|uniref:hypothetical protein n=1 Tax=Burkholderia gladioli TaxID=28095 RepID=UPI003B509BD3